MINGGFINFSSLIVSDVSCNGFFISELLLNSSLKKTIRIKVNSGEALEVLYEQMGLVCYSYFIL